MENLNIEKTLEETPAQKFLQLIKQLIKEEQYDGIALLFTGEQEADRNVKHIDEVGMDLLHDVCLPNLNDQNHSEKFALYCCAQDILKVIAAHAPAEELLLELLELVEEQKSEHVFTSALRALQVVLLRMGDQKPRALEWSLNSIYTRLQELSLPDYLTEGYDSKQERLLEQNKQVQTLLMYYITVDLFYEPLVKDVVVTRARPAVVEQIFQNNGINRRNVLCCFLIQLLGKPLSLLDLTVDERKTNTYTIQNAQNLTKAATQCIGDPFRLLALVEQRVRWKRRINNAKGVHAICSSNIFLVEEKLPLDALAIYFYMLLVEEIGSTDLALPKVYAPLFILESGLYLATELLSHAEPPLNMRALLLTKRLLSNLQEIPIPAIFLELEVYKNFCHSLCNIVAFSSQVDLRQQGVQLLRKYILQFDDEGKYLVLKNLLRSIDHTGISGYLAIMYKDLVAGALVTSATVSLPISFSGKDFRTIFLQNMCCLPQGAETDLIDYSDKIISALNALRFFAIKDCNNRTGFWDFISDIEHQFLDPLRKGLNISIAHYKAELERIEKGSDAAEDAAELAHLKMLDISIANASSEKSKVDLEINRQHKINILNQNLCTFDLMRSLLARATECVENSGKICKLKQQAQDEIYAHNSFLACSTYASSLSTKILLERQQQIRLQKCQSTSKCFSTSTQDRLMVTTQQQHLKQRRSYSQAPTIDEFRAREEQREEEFARKQTDEERKKTNAEDAEKQAKVDAIRAQILEAALTHVPTLGWTRKAIVQGAEDAGFPSVVHGMFPDGGFALVSHFYGKSNDELIKRLRDETQNGQKEIANPLDFLVHAVRMRLEMIVPYKAQWSQALALIALPQNASTALAQVLTLVDDICYYSGDRSVDIGWYTRRIGLATIMKMTELYMLQDSSPNHSNTWEFLKNRMDEAVQLQMMLSSTEGVTHNFQRSFNSAFITARNILGLDYNRR